jgi:MFS family permease
MTPLRAIWPWIKENALLATSGGGWSKAVSHSVQKNLRWFFMDGVLGSCLDGAVGPYLTLYLLALGATSGQIGVMTSLAGLFATLALLPGAMLSEITGKRKLYYVFGGAGFARLMILIQALLPLFMSWPAAIPWIIVLKVMGDGLGSFSGPAWTSLAGDLVPLTWRGRFFGSRNLFMSASSMTATFLAGIVISRLGASSGSITGYQVAFAIAFLFGLASSISFYQIDEPDTIAKNRDRSAYSLRSVLQTVVDDAWFRRYMVFAIIWNLAYGLTAPYFTVYMIQGLNATAAQVGLLTIASGLAALPALRVFGHLADRWGARKVQLLTGLLIPLLPLAWILASTPLHGILLNIPGGMLWAGFNLASFNYLLSLAPTDKRARYHALFQIAVTLTSAAGTFLGSLVIAHWGYHLLFALSGIGRYMGIIYFARFGGGGEVTSTA